MKYLFAILAALTLLVSTVHAAPVTMAWDYDVEAQSGITGFQVFAVPVIDDFNYEIPVATVDNNTLAATFDINANVELKFVVRAYLDTGSTIYVSPDSVQVQHAVILMPVNLRID